MLAPHCGLQKLVDYFGLRQRNPKLYSPPPPFGYKNVLLCPDVPLPRPCTLSRQSEFWTACLWPWRPGSVFFNAFDSMWRSIISGVNHPWSGKNKCCSLVRYARSTWTIKILYSHLLQCGYNQLLFYQVIIYIYICIPSEAENSQCAVCMRVCMTLYVWVGRIILQKLNVNPWECARIILGLERLYYGHCYNFYTLDTAITKQENPLKLPNSIICLPVWASLFLDQQSLECGTDSLLA